MLLVLFLGKVHSRYDLLALLKDMVTEGLSDRLQVLLLLLVIVEGVQEAQVVEQVMLQ